MGFGPFIVKNGQPGNERKAKIETSRYQTDQLSRIGNLSVGSGDFSRVRPPAAGSKAAVVRLSRHGRIREYGKVGLRRNSLLKRTEIFPGE
jgi:hypothetical protein